jgi:hypothetical protein
MAGAYGLLAVCTVGCHVFGSGPTDQEVVAAIKKSPPSPPTVGPTYLAEIESVEIQERGRYNRDGSYWPIRVRMKGRAKIKMTSILQLGLLGDPEKQPRKAVDFIEEARLAKDASGNWQVAYNYDPRGPKWRLDQPDTAPGP